MKISHLLLGTLAAVMAAIIKKWVRPAVVARGIEDVGLSDYSPSFLYVFGLLLFLTAFKALERYNRYLLIGGFLGAVLYEILQIVFFPARTFDWGDLIATLLGAACSYAVILTLQNGMKIS